MAGRPGPSWSNITIEHDDEDPSADDQLANDGAGEPTATEPTPAAHPRKQGLKTRMRQAWYGLGRSGKGSAGSKNGGSAGSKIPISIEGNGGSLAGWEMPSAGPRGPSSSRGDLPPPPPGYGGGGGAAALSPLGSLTWEADEEGQGDGASMPGQKVRPSSSPLL